MTSHPNRSKYNPKIGATPTPAQLKAAREAVGLTIEQAAPYIFVTTRAWQNYEAGPEAVNHRDMKPAQFALFLLLTGQVTLDQVLAAIDR